jgi:formate hydrogenlyase transcriptional activator
MARIDPGEMIGQSPAFRVVLNTIGVVAPTDATVLISGETGTGKGLLARMIHDLSPRRSNAFVTVNCAAIPTSLLESELFGHEKGAFTSAVAQRIGRLELASGGTLFLDEVGEIPLELQAKLLRAIQEKEFERVGGIRTVHVDVRFIAATNRVLQQMVYDRLFRSDLYYRLNVFPVAVPPLRERREDVPMLVRHFVKIYSQRFGRHIETIAKSTLDALTTYDWPGNIRELQNMIERSVILSTGSEFCLPSAEFVSLVPGGMANDSTGGSALGKEEILRALEATKGRVGGPNGAAVRLGLKRTTLQSRMKRLNIVRAFR